jgi:predicted transcriptional regulator/transcriptional regulator with XRE-family HTH domain
MKKPVFLGRRIRALRTRIGLSQAELAKRLGVSPTYLNLLEHDRRPVTSALLLELARVLDVDLRVLASGGDAEMLAALSEVFSEPLFEDHPLTKQELSAFLDSNPEVARAVLVLHRAFAGARDSLNSLGERLLDYQQDVGAVDRVRLSSEQVSDFIQRNGNYFPALETEAERLLAGIEGGDGEELFARLTRYLKTAHGVRVRIVTHAEIRGAVRRFDPEKREVLLSEVLRRGSRNFQLAAQIGLLRCGRVLDDLTVDPKLTNDESRALCRVALASYFAGAVVMPYDEFLRAAEAERYDIELLGHRFRVGWEQTCHRLTTLRRPGAEGVPFYYMRVDLAGNISKRFSAAGIQFPRFSGLCSLWNVHAAFLQPGRVRVQLSQMVDGHRVLAVARTVQRHSAGYSAPEAPYAVGVGCDVSHASKVVYGDGLNLESATAAVPIGVTCRLCERQNCTARAFPSIGGSLRIDENVRGASFFASVGEK